MKLAKDDRFLLIGDSVTDCGRERPVGEAPGGLGNGYASQVAALLGTWYPERRIRVMNTGSSGDTARHLAARWQTDVLDLQPDWLSVMIGINDVWRQFDRTLRPEHSVLPKEYEKTLDTLLKKTRPRVKGIVLATPYFVEPQRGDAMRARMDEYGAVIARLAKRHRAVFVDTQAAFDQTLTASGLYSASLAGDRVHPNVAGHMVLARAILSALDFEWSR